MSKINGFVSSACADPMVVSTVTMCVSSVSPGSGVFTISVSMESPLPLIPVPQQDRREVHQEDRSHQDEDGGRSDVLERWLRLLRVHVDQCRERGEAPLERFPDPA